MLIAGCVALQAARCSANPPIRDSAESRARRGAPEREETRLALALDIVVGFSSGALLAHTHAPTSAKHTASFVTQSIVIGAAYDFDEHHALEVRIPATFGSASGNAPSRSITALGNLELEAQRTSLLARQIRMTFGVALALPTGQGEPHPPTPALATGHDDFEQSALQRAASAARGYEDEALFEHDHVGLIPKICFNLRHEQFLLRPSAKLEILASSHAADIGTQPLLLEAVIATYIGIQLDEYVDIGTRVWADVELLGHAPSVAVVEPRFDAHFGPFDFTLGGIWVFAGERAHRQFGGVRAMLGTRV